jgi:D-sedoheptulose 7-phosphate isomerase
MLQVSALISRLPFALIDKTSELLFESYEQGRTVFLFGNGGSAALASHMACDLGKGTSSPDNQKRMRVLALTDNVPTITAWANDANYEDIFAEQLKNFARKDDLALAISGSGNSPNVLKALQTAREIGMKTIGVGGFAGGRMKEFCDINLIVTCDNMQFIEDLHLCIAHCVFTLLRDRINTPVNLGSAATAAGVGSSARI